MSTIGPPSARPKLVLPNNMISPVFASWSTSGSHTAVTTNAAMGPDRTQTAATVLEDGATNDHSTNSPAVTKAASVFKYECSIWVRRHAGTRNAILRCFNGAFTSLAGVGFNLSDGSFFSDVVSGFTLDGVSARKLFDFYLFKMLFTTDASADLNVLIYLHNGSGTNYAGDSTSGLVVWRPKLQQI